MKKIITIILSVFLSVQVVNAWVNYHYFKTKSWKHMCVVAWTKEANLCLKYGIIYKWDQVIKWDWPSAYVWMENAEEITYETQTFCVKTGAEVDTKICVQEKAIKESIVEEELSSTQDDESMGEITSDNVKPTSTWSISNTVKNPQTTKPQTTSTNTTKETKTQTWNTQEDFTQEENIEDTSSWEVIELKNNIEEVEDVTTEPITQTWSEEGSWALDEQTSSGTIQKIDNENTSKTCNIWPLKVDCGVLKWDFSSIKYFKEIAWIIWLVLFVIIILSLSKKKKPKVQKVPEKKEPLDPLAEANDFF